MTEIVVLRPGRDHDASRDSLVEWIVVDDNGTRRSPPGRGTLGEVAAKVRNRPVILLLPATDVLTTTVDLPVRTGAKLNAALPYALEDQVAADIETMHFAAGDKRDSRLRPVAAVATEQLDGWLEKLDAAGILPWKVVPENYGLARIPGTMSMLIDGDYILFNDGSDTEFAMQDVNPSDVLVAAGQLSDHGPDDASLEAAGHLVVYCDAADEERLSHDWIALRHELHSVDINLLPDGALPRLAVTVASGQGVNMLQGAYGPKADYGSWIRPWRRVAVLALGLAILGFAGKGADYYRLYHEDMALRDRFTQEFRQIRPGDAAEIRDPAAAVMSVRRSLGAGTAPQIFLPQLRALSGAIAKNSRASVDAISYRAGVIDVRLSSPDVETVGEVQKAISASGQFVASIQSTDKVADHINSRIQIHEAGS